MRTLHTRSCTEVNAPDNVLHANAAHLVAHCRQDMPPCSRSRLPLIFLPGPEHDLKLLFPVMFQRCLGPEHDRKLLPWRDFFGLPCQSGETACGLWLKVTRLCLA